MSGTRLDLLADILAREFRKAASQYASTQLRISWPENTETIEIFAGADRWVMEIGSDDDEFRFELRSGRKGRVIRFDLPQDWIDANENYFEESEMKEVYIR